MWHLWHWMKERLLIFYYTCKNNFCFYILCQICPKRVKKKNYYKSCIWTFILAQLKKNYKYLSFYGICIIFLFVPSYGFWKTHYILSIKTDQENLSVVRCQAHKSWWWVATYVQEYAFKAGEESDLIHNFCFDPIFTAFLDCLHTQIENWQSSLNNLPIQTISNWGSIFVQRWMLWYMLGLHNCTKFYTDLF